MRASRAVLLLGVALALAACAKQPSGGDRTSSVPTAQVKAPAARVAAGAPAAQSAAQTSKLNRDGSETVEEAAGDSGAHNALLAAVASTVAAATPTASANVPAGPSAWQEGVNYTRIVPGQPTDVPPGQVEVLEFFWYACPHCFSLEPMVEAWKKSKPSYITFVPVPVTWSDGHRALARLFYTLDSLGKLDQLHGEVFKEIQVSGDPLIGPDPNDAAAAERVQLAFIKKLGLSEAAFEKAYHEDMNVQTAMQRADQLVQRYRVGSVPMFVVNGKYTTDVTMAGSPEKLMSMLSDLTAQEHKH